MGNTVNVKRNYHHKKQLMGVDR